MLVAHRRIPSSRSAHSVETLAGSADRHRAVQEALLARARLGIGTDSPLPDILRLIEDVAEVPITVLPLPEGFAGAIGRKRGRDFIFINSEDQPVRRRFTLAHEFGHHTLGHGPLIDREDDIEGKSDRRRPEEAEANYFAAEFLAPEQAVHRFVQARKIDVVDLSSVVLLADFFGISAKAARIRLEAVGLLNKRKDRETLDRGIDCGDHSQLARELGLGELPDSLSKEKIPLGERRLPGAVFRRVIRAYSSGLLPVEKLAAQVGMTPTDLGWRLRDAGVEAPPVDDED